MVIEIKLEDCTPPGVSIKDTNFGYTLSLIGGKHKMIIIYCLAQNDNLLRFNELHRLLVNVSYTALSNALKELESCGLIERIEYPQIPPKVEYKLTEKGFSLIPVMEQLCEWGKKHRPKDDPD
ncbi:helix-turn-helix transcriptional regulator [Synergistaceae bacterium OttesenSCG-928-I11]|nr:helix-turn-helix transcriptional regulator [Synergistaceae bacterium OttesenSCG-928-I11]